MEAFRSVTIGMLGACLWLVLAVLPRTQRIELSIVAPPSSVASAPRQNMVSIIDLAAHPGDRGPEWSIRDLVDMIPLGRGESIIEVDDLPVVVDQGCSAAPYYCAGVVLREGRHVEHAPYTLARSYVDFTIASGSDRRRVLVLVH